MSHGAHHVSVLRTTGTKWRGNGGKRTASHSHTDTSAGSAEGVAVCVAVRVAVCVAVRVVISIVVGVAIRIVVCVAVNVVRHKRVADKTVVHAKTDVAHAKRVGTTEGRSAST